MATWTSAADATAGDRLLNVQGCALQLSDGALVFLQYDPGATSPNYVSLMVAADHTSTPVFVGTVSATNFALNSIPMQFCLIVDQYDNLYVVGADAGDGDTWGVQSFIKKTGHIWTTGTYSSAGTSQTEGQSLAAMAGVWCNTGGGFESRGHLLIVGTDGAGNVYACVMDASRALNGPVGEEGTNLIVRVTKNPAFLGGGSSSAWESNLDLSADGFGSTSGLAINATTTTKVTIGAWGITGSGALTTGGGLVTTSTTGTLTSTTKCHLIRQSPNLWVALYNSTGTPTQLTAQCCSSSASLGTLSALGTASNFPAKAATLSWAACAGSTTPVSQIWVFGFSSQAGHLDDLLGLPVVVTTPSSPSAGSVVAQNLAVSGGGASADMSTLRLVKQPVDTLHVDWQAYKSTSTYGLYGYFSALPAGPSLPLLTYPTSGSVVPLVATNLALNWTFQSSVVGDTQTGAYVRRQLVGSGYQWWTGAAWTAQQAGATGGAEVAVTALTTAQTVTTGTWVAADVYSYSVQTIGGTGLLSGYASPVSFTIANTAPATPTLTANYGSGGNATTLTLTGNAAGPTGSIEFSDDGVNWTFCRGATALTCYSSAAVVVDYDTNSGTTRQYRARVWTSYPTSYSAYATANAFPVITTFWISDPVGGTKIAIHIPKGTLKTQFPQQLTEHQGLGNAFATIVADVMGLEDGACTMWTQSASDETALLALLTAPQTTLLLECPDNRRWYLRINSVRNTDVPYLVGVGTYRTHDITWRGQTRPA